MTCLICGARCQCKKAPPGLCCSCHNHKVRRVKRFTYSPEWRDRGVTLDNFNASLGKHLEAAEQKVLEFNPR